MAEMEIDLRWVRRQRGYVFRKLRERRGVRLADAAALVGTSRTRLHKIEHGKCRVSFPRLLRAIDVLSADASEAALLISLDLLERARMLPEPLQRVFDLAAGGFAKECVAMTESDPVARQSGPDRPVLRPHRPCEPAPRVRGKATAV